MRDVLWKLRVLIGMMRSDFRYWRDNLWPIDPDTPACCDGRECGCYGQTIREVYDA